MWIRNQLDNGNQQFLAQGGGSDISENIFTFDEVAGVEAAIGRGTLSDTAKCTYLRLQNEAGTNVYLYVDEDTSTLVVSATKP
jgi:hypothetical protein